MHVWIPILKFWNFHDFQTWIFHDLRNLKKLDLALSIYEIEIS